MTTYIIEGKTVVAEKPLTDSEIDEIAAKIRAGNTTSASTQQSTQPISPMNEAGTGVDGALATVAKLLILVIVAAVALSLSKNKPADDTTTTAHEAGSRAAGIGVGLSALASGRHLFLGTVMSEFLAVAIFTAALFGAVGYVIGRMAHKD